METKIIFIYDSLKQVEVDFAMKLLNVEALPEGSVCLMDIQSYNTFVDIEDVACKHAIDDNLLTGVVCFGKLSEMVMRLHNDFINFIPVFFIDPEPDDFEAWRDTHHIIRGGTFTDTISQILFIIHSQKK